MMKNGHDKISVILLLLICSSTYCHGTGFYGPNFYLDNGGKMVESTPEFYWEWEIKRLAKDFHPSEKRVSPPIKSSSDDEKATSLDTMTEDADLQDFDAAVKAGSIKPSDPSLAREQHQAARKLIAGDQVLTVMARPAEFDSEFSDYHLGALAYRQEKWGDAKTAWETLLKRPVKLRHYRTIWATYMLGKIALKNKDPQSVKWFQQTRSLAKQGFCDSLGMAADSYGWEARAELDQLHMEKAARLYLTQLSLGDESAIVSLKALIPDRSPVEAGLNFGPETDDQSKWDDKQKNAYQKETLAKLKIAAADPILRRLVTMHILATETYNTNESYRVSDSKDRCSRWLSVLNESHLGKIEDAEYIGWIAYNNGDFDQAEHWLKMADKNAPAACWLRAKLQRRDGDLGGAARSMEQALKMIRDVSSYTQWMHTSDGIYSKYKVRSEDPGFAFNERVTGDFGALQLEQNDFVEAMDTFLKGHLWEDAFFVAERILTVNELRQYVDKQPITSKKSTTSEPDLIDQLRYLLGRRLVQNERYQEASQYLPAPYNQTIKDYARFIDDGKNPKKSKSDQARTWFKVAWMTRHLGMELMGTEGVPDGFEFRGEFESIDIAQQWQKGVYDRFEWVNNNEKKIVTPIALKPTDEEIRRLGMSKISPDVRYHYRLIAATYAIRAARLLPDQTEELADVLNQAGLWVKESDEKLADSYYNMLEARCSNTKLGKQVLAKHWFVDTAGPWSQELQTTYPPPSS